LHIPEDLPRALPHLDVMDPNHRHALEIEMGTIMERVYGEAKSASTACTTWPLMRWRRALP